MDPVSFNTWHFVHLLVVLHSHCSFNAFIFTDHTQPSIVSKFWLTNSCICTQAKRVSLYWLQFWLRPACFCIHTHTLFHIKTWAWLHDIHPGPSSFWWTSEQLHSEKKTVIKITMKPRTEKDNHHILSRQYHVGLLRFCSGHNRLNNQRHDATTKRCHSPFACAPAAQRTRQLSTSSRSVQAICTCKKLVKTNWPVETPCRPSSTALSRTWREQFDLSGGPHCPCDRWIKREIKEK